MVWIYKPKKNRNRSNELKRKERMKIYNSVRWRNLRALKMTNNPLCEICEANGKITPVDDVHHMISFMSVDDPVRRYHLAYDYDNLQSVCDECHQKIHNNFKTYQHEKD